jgi:hypothetical protein
MRSVNALVLMDGTVDLAQENQNMHVVVIPEINAGAASVAYGLINPVLGLGSFLAQLFLRDPLMRAFTMEYQISGSWKDPNIRKLPRSAFAEAPKPGNEPNKIKRARCHECRPENRRRANGFHPGGGRKHRTGRAIAAPGRRPRARNSGAAARILAHPRPARERQVGRCRTGRPGPDPAMDGRHGARARHLADRRHRAAGVAGRRQGAQHLPGLRSRWRLAGAL